MGSVKVRIGTGARHANWRTAIDRLPAEWSSVRHPCLGVWDGVDDKGGALSWILPDKGLQPISGVGVPRSSEEVTSLIRQ